MAIASAARAANGPAEDIAASIIARQAVSAAVPMLLFRAKNAHETFAQCVLVQLHDDGQDV